MLFQSYDKNCHSSRSISIQINIYRCLQNFINTKIGYSYRNEVLLLMNIPGIIPKCSNANDTLLVWKVACKKLVWLSRSFKTMLISVPSCLKRSIELREGQSYTALADTSSEDVLRLRSRVNFNTQSVTSVRYSIFIFILDHKRYQRGSSVYFSNQKRNNIMLWFVWQWNRRCVQQSHWAKWHCFNWRYRWHWLSCRGHSQTLWSWCSIDAHKPWNHFELYENQWIYGEASTTHIISGSWWSVYWCFTADFGHWEFMPQVNQYQ